jgi:hypothetical protein
MNINVAVSIDLMTSPEGFGAIDVPAIKHICLVGNNRAMVQAGSTQRRPQHMVQTMPDHQDITASC